MHHTIVHVDEIHCPLLNLEIAPPHTADIIKYDRTWTKEELHQRIKDATIVISIAVRINESEFDSAVTPKLQYVAISATGADKIDCDAAAKRGVWVTNSPGANIDAVSEHALALYFASRRRVILMHNVTIAVPSEWKKQGTITRYLQDPSGVMPPTCSDEICGIIGYGALGKRISSLAKALGMQVIIADRKGSTKQASQLETQDPPRVPFTEVLKRSTCIFVCAPYTKETVNMISEPEFDLMTQRTVLINIARGGIVNEAATVQALRQNKIAGFAADVTEVEPAEGEKDCPFLSPAVKDLNITISPHVSWYAGRTIVNLQNTLKRTVEAWIAGNPINVVVGPDQWVKK